MIDSECVRLNLPCPEHVFTFEEPFEGLNLVTLTFPFEASRFGMGPYFIAALHLWAQATYRQVKGGRRYTRHHLGNPEASSRQLEKEIDDFHGSLPLPMQWSMHNRKVFRHMSQEGLFINFHFLLNHARCVMRQEYLPYGDATYLTLGNGAPSNDYDWTGTCLDGRAETTVSVCISSSEAIVDMVSELSSPNGCGRSNLQSVFAAVAMLSAANIQLWLQYVDRKDDETCERAALKLEEIAAVFESWRTQWSVADAWMSTLASLRRLYQATYAPNLSPRDGDMEVSAGAPPALTESDAHDRPYSDLTEGNGLPELKEQIFDKIRFILLASLEETGAKERVLRPSMSKIKQRVWDYEGFSEGFECGLPEDMEYGYPALYTSESWSGFVGSPAVGNHAAQ